MDTPNNVTGAEQTVPQNTSKAPDQSKGSRMLFGILSYLGLLVVIPLIAKRDDAFIKFHVKQGLVLVSIEVILWVLSSVLMMGSLWPLYRLVHLALVVLTIIGIVNVVQGKEKELPFVGEFAKYFSI